MHPRDIIQRLCSGVRMALPITVLSIQSVESCWKDMSPKYSPMRNRNCLQDPRADLSGGIELVSILDLKRQVCSKDNVTLQAFGMCCIWIFSVV